MISSKFSKIGNWLNDHKGPETTPQLAFFICICYKSITARYRFIKNAYWGTIVKYEGMFYDHHTATSCSEKFVYV